MSTIFYETAPAPQVDGTNVVVDSTTGKLSLGTTVTSKLPNKAPTTSDAGKAPVVQSDGSVAWETIESDSHIQILGTVSGSTAKFTDATYISTTADYLYDVYCSDSARYIKSQSISVNTLTVVFDDSVASATCVLVATEKEV